MTEVYCSQAIADAISDLMYGGESAWLKIPTKEFIQRMRQAWNTRADGWVSVEDRLPDDSDTVIACNAESIELLDGKFPDGNL